MKIIFLFWGAILFILFSCSDKDKLPENILPREKMEAVMWDMLRAGEFLDSYVFNRDTSVDKVVESERWYDRIYQLHNITEEQFRKSFAYYKDNLEAFKPILDSLSKKEMEDTQPAPVTEDSAGLQSPIDTNLLKRKDSLLKIQTQSKLKSRLDKIAN